MKTTIAELINMTKLKGDLKSIFSRVDSFERSNINVEKENVRIEEKTKSIGNSKTNLANSSLTNNTPIIAKKKKE